MRHTHKKNQQQACPNPVPSIETAQLRHAYVSSQACTDPHTHIRSHFSSANSLNQSPSSPICVDELPKSICCSVLFNKLLFYDRLFCLSYLTLFLCPYAICNNMQFMVSATPTPIHWSLAWQCIASVLLLYLQDRCLLVHFFWGASARRLLPDTVSGSDTSGSEQRGVFIKPRVAWSEGK